jgi:beta-lactamase class A
MNRRIRRTLLGALTVAAFVGTAGPARAQTSGWPWAPVARAQRTDTAALRATLDAIADAHHGTVGYAVWNLETGEKLARRGDEPFPTASLIKVPILVSLFLQVQKGTISLDDPVSFSKIDQVGGAGVLHLFRPGAILHVADVAMLMITLSDNSATNLLLDKLGIKQVWSDMERLGLPRTKVFAKVFKRGVSSVAIDSSEKYGLGVSTPNEMARLYQLLAEGRAVSPAADSAMLAMLNENQDAEMLQRRVGELTAAHKTGAVDESRTECTLWPLAGRVVACVFTHHNADHRYASENEAHLTMARMGEAIVAAWRPPAAK